MTIFSFFCSWAQSVFWLRRGLRGPGEIREIIFGVALWVQDANFKFRILSRKSFSQILSLMISMIPPKVVNRILLVGLWLYPWCIICQFLSATPFAFAVVRPTRFDLPQATDRTPSVPRVQLEGRSQYHTCVSYSVGTPCKCKCVCQLCRILRSFGVFLLTYGYRFCVQALN